MLRDRAAYNALNGSGAPFADMYLGSPGDSDFAAVNNAPAGAGRSIPFNLIPIALLGIIVFLLWKR